MTETTRLALVLIAGLLAMYAFSRAIKAEEPSRSLAGWALCLGLGTLAFYPTPSSLLGFDPVTDPIVFPAAQVVRVVAGLAALALGIAALDRRRRDGGAGVAGPLLALLLAALHVGVGVHNFREGRRLANALALEEPSPEGQVAKRSDFQLRLPSSRWIENSRSPDGWAGFSHVFYPMHVFIVSASGGEESDFEAAAREATSGMERDAERAPPKPERGTNAKGCRYLYATRTERNKDTPVFVATSVTWCPVPYTVVGSPSGVLVELLFEAKLADRMPADTVAKNAEFICKSVEPKQPVAK